MTVEDKREAVNYYCGSTTCDRCTLNGAVWDHKYLEFGRKCLSINEADESELNRALALIGLIDKEDPVNRPAHYTDGKIEVIDFIEDKKLGFCLGNAIKYIARAGKKDPSKEVEDLNKAKWYIERRIKELKEGIA